MGSVIKRKPRPGQTKKKIKEFLVKAEKVGKGVPEKSPLDKEVAAVVKRRRKKEGLAALSKLVSVRDGMRKRRKTKKAQGF